MVTAVDQVWATDITYIPLQKGFLYLEVYLRAYSDGWEAEISLARFLWRYCHVRPHSSLGGRTPPQRFAPYLYLG
jgi:transposase InsO family protein